MTHNIPNEDAPAFPVHDVRNSLPGAGAITTTVRGGLSKRELFAAMAMQGWLAGCGNAYSEFTGLNTDVAATSSVKLADALLAALKEVQ